jgi:hypothetical protein
MALERTATPRASYLSDLRDATRRASLSALRLRALAYRAARRAARAYESALAECRKLGLPEQTFHHAFEVSLAAKVEHWCRSSA